MWSYLIAHLPRRTSEASAAEEAEAASPGVFLW